MTTIAYRAGKMVGDTAIFDRGTYCGEAVKIFRAPDGRLGGLAGCFGDSAMFRKWFAEGAEGDPPEFKDEESEGVIAHPDGTIEWVGHGRKRVQITAPFIAIGSGFCVAMGALHAGATAERAIEIAADLDCMSRRPLIALQHKD